MVLQESTATTINYQSLVLRAQADLQSKEGQSWNLKTKPQNKLKGIAAPRGHKS